MTDPARDAPLRILILEDVEADAELLERELQRGGLQSDTRRVDAEASFVDALDQYHPDIVLADYSLPGFDGLRALEITLRRAPGVPFVFVSGTMGEDVAVDMLKAGALDYVVKGHLLRLVPAVRRALKDAGAAAERARMQAEFQRYAREQEVVAALGTSALHGTQIGALCAEAVVSLAATLGADCADVRETAPGGASLQKVADFGWSDPAALDDADAQALHALRTGKPVVVADLVNERRFPVPEALRERGIASGASVVIGPHDSPYGVLSVQSERLAAFGAHDVRFLQAIANVLAGAIGRTRADARTARIARLYSALAHTNEAMLRGRSRDQVFADACRIAVTRGMFRMAWVCLVDERSRRMVSAARDGFVDGYLDAFATGTLDPDTAPGPTATAIREGRTVVINSIASDAQMTDIREAALARGYMSVASFPLREDGRIIGALTSYASEAAMFQEEETQLLENLVADLSYALDAIKTREAHEQAQAAVREAEERFEDVFQNAVEGIVQTTVDGRLLIANESAARLFGYASADELLSAGLDTRDLWVDIGRRDELFRLLQGEAFVTSFEAELRRRDGTRFWASMSVRPLRRPDGEIYGAESMLVDVTERKEWREALRESESRFRQLVENIREVFWLHSVPENRMLYGSPAYERVFDMSLEAAYADPRAWTTKIHPDDREPVLASIAAHRSAIDEFTEHEFRIVRDDGEVRWLRTRAVPIRDESGKVVRLAGVTEDFTERKLAEEATRLAHERLIRTLESLTDGFLMVDHDWRITYMNPRGREMLPADAADPIGTRVWDIGNAAEFVSREAAIEARRTGEAILLESLNRTTNQWFEIHAYPSPDGFSVFYRDISDRKRADDELQRSFDLLRKTDEQRQRLLRRVVTAQEQERQRIAADIHDDTIQVLVALGIRLDTLRRQISDPGLMDKVASLTASAELAIARVRRLIFELRPPVLDREGLAPAIRSYLDQLTDDAGVECTLENRLVEEPPIEVRVSVYRIAQEALTNVRKHAHATQVKVDLETRGGGVLVRVRDDGTGFASSQTPEPGHLGLVSMRERAEVAGGWCTVDATEGRGTTVEFWLPWAAATFARVS